MARPHFYAITRRKPGEYEIIIDGRPEPTVLSAIEFLVFLRKDAFPEEQIKRIFATLDKKRFIRVSVNQAD